VSWALLGPQLEVWVRVGLLALRGPQLHYLAVVLLYYLHIPSFRINFSSLFPLLQRRLFGLGRVPLPPAGLSLPLRQF
jgi:hypothetical protein